MSLAKKCCIPKDRQIQKLQERNKRLVTTLAYMKTRLLPYQRWDDAPLIVQEVLNEQENL